MAVLTSSQIVLEWSADPLSDTTPTYVTIPNTEIRSVEWWAGVDREGNETEPGGMIVTLKSVRRKWEPLFGSNTIDTQQRFRLTVAGVQEGVFYSQDFELSYPSGQEYSEVTVTCGDGFDVLALDDLPTLDPPDADSYEDVVNFDEPWGYWRLGDPAGTRAAAIVRRHHRGKGKHRRRWRTFHGQRTRILSEAGGVSGPAGTYKRLPTLGQPGAIVGDPDTAVLFTGVSGTNGNYMRANLDDVASLSASGEATVECWVYLNSANNGPILFVGGPTTSGGADRVLELGMEWAGNDGFFFRIVDAAGGAARAETGVTASTGEWTHLAGVFRSSTAYLYVNAELVATATSSPGLATPDANSKVEVGGRTEVSTFDYSHVVDEPAMYERALTEARILARYTAGAERGYPQQTAGERIAAIATSDLWAETEIQTSGRDVVPVMQHGQPRLDEISETMHAEGPKALFFFNGDGNPVYLGHEFQASAAEYNTVQATFGDGGGTTIPYQHIDLDYDNEVYNEIVASREGGPLITAADTTSSAQRGRRARTEETDLLLTDDIYVESLAGHVLRTYAAPAMRPVTLTIDNHHALTQIKTLDIGHLVRVQKEGVTGDPIDRVTHIIGKRKAISLDRLYTCTYTLGRGFDGNEDGWRAGVVGFSEAGSTTIAG